MSYESMRIERSEHVAELILTGPGKGNAMGPAFFAELPRAIDELEADASVRVIVLRGQNGIFTYGLDLKAMVPTLAPFVGGQNLASERQKLLDLIVRLQEGFRRVEKCRKPVIAAIAGLCIGGGVDLISACDVRVASKDARFSVREVKLAIVADMGSLQRLPRIIGHGHTRELAFTGKDIDAARAKEIALVNDVYDDEAALLDAARTMARSIADNSPVVVQGVKQVLDYCEGKSIEDGERFVAVWNAAFLASNDLMEAMQAFMEKRPAKFTGT